MDIKKTKRSLVKFLDDKQIIPIGLVLFLGFAGLVYIENNTERKIKRQEQEYKELYDKATKCVEQDGIKGLSSLGEIDELYSRVGEFKMPPLERGDLERVVQSCEANGKLLK